MKTTKNELEQQVRELTQQLQAERAKTQNFATILGQMRYRVFEVLELEPQVRTQIVTEIDTVFSRAL
tara:strand:- start:1921 stop:2121 length:201 start_codon:yes stop_codon:yes gene_type:complete